MLEFKNTGRARVVNAFDGRVIKCFNGPNAVSRFQNECRVLRHLNELDCPFVPRLMDSNSSRLSITTAFCGHRVEQLLDTHVQKLFDRLLEYRVRHDDPALRNILFDPRSNEFMLIDFELAQIMQPSLLMAPQVEPILENLDGLFSTSSINLTVV